MIKLKTFEEAKEDEFGTVYVDEITKYGLRCLVLRGPASLCAYIGVPKGHPFWNQSYEWVDENYPIRVHGGLTFAGRGLKSMDEDQGRWFLGWDYAHYEDYTFYNDILKLKIPVSGHKWTVEEVLSELLEVLPEFEKVYEVNIWTKIKLWIGQTWHRISTNLTRKYQNLRKILQDWLPS